MSVGIKEFCEAHNACEEGVQWALSTGKETMAELWALDMKSEWRVWIATRKGVLDDRTLRLFACFCARQNWGLLADERSRNAVETAERFADGKATAEDMAAASEAAWEAYRYAASAWALAASEAAWEASWAAACAAAWAAAWSAAWEASREAARAAASADLKAAQSEWLIENTIPNFNKEAAP